MAWAATTDKAHLRIAVNVSAREIHQTDFVQVVFADKSQSGMRAEFVGQLLDNKASHARVHRLGESHMPSKSLIPKKSTNINYEVTDSSLLQPVVGTTSRTMTHKQEYGDLKPPSSIVKWCPKY